MLELRHDTWQGISTKILKLLSSVVLLLLGMIRACSSPADPRNEATPDAAQDRSNPQLSTTATTLRIASISSSGPILPLDEIPDEDLQGFLSQLSNSERDCVSSNVSEYHLQVIAGEDLGENMSGTISATEEYDETRPTPWIEETSEGHFLIMGGEHVEDPADSWIMEKEAQIERNYEAWTPFIECLHAETLLRLMFSLDDEHRQIQELASDTWSCMRAGYGAIDLRSIVTEHIANTWHVSTRFYSICLTVPCLSDEEWEEYLSALQKRSENSPAGELEWHFIPTLREPTQCMVAAYGGPEGMGAELQFFFENPTDSDTPGPRATAFSESLQKCGIN